MQLLNYRIQAAPPRSEKAMINEISKNDEDSIETVHRNLIASSRNSLPEAIFIAEFLPYFSGQLRVEKTNDVFLKWVGIAGMPSNEVSIINEMGEVLYTVPSLIDTSVINVKGDSSGSSISELMRRYTIRTNITPALGTEYLNNAKDKVIEATIKQGKNQLDSIKRWDAIFARYNNESSSIEGINKKLKSDPEELTYDDTD